MTSLAFPARCATFETDRQLGDQITLLAGRINAANYRLLKLIAEFDRRKAWSGGGTVRSCAHWLNWQCGIALVAARERVRVARALEELPLIDAAFARGEISYSKVRAMTRVATPENEDYLLLIACHGTASHVEQVVRKYRRVTRQDDEVAEREQDRSRELVYYRDDDGMWIIHARLPPEAGSLVVKAIEAVAGQAGKDAKHDSAASFSDAVERPWWPSPSTSWRRLDRLPGSQASGVASAARWCSTSISRPCASRPSGQLAPTSTAISTRRRGSHRQRPDAWPATPVW